MSWLDYFKGMIKTRGSSAISDRLVSYDPTAGYNAHRDYYSELIVTKLPLYHLRTGRLMLSSDPIVEFALNVRNAALMVAEMEVECGNPNVKKWLEKQWDTLWNKHRSKLLSAKKWGFAPLQPTFTKRNGLTHIDGLKEFAPEDVKAQECGGKLCGFKVKNEVKLFQPQALWITFNAECGSPYGTGCLRRAYPPWYEKWMDHGARKLLQLRMIKDAYIGDIFWCPFNLKVQMPDGKVMPWRDLCRELEENRLSGGAMVLPSMYDDKGNKLVDYSPPTDVAGGSQIFEWGDKLDEAILRGADVPIEVVKAQENGGFSGRSIPFMVVLSVCTQEFTEIVQCIDQQVFRPLVWLNFGRDVEYELKPKSLVESFAADAGGSPMGGAAIGGQAGQRPPGMQQQQQAQQIPQRQEAVQFDETHHAPAGGVTLKGKRYEGGEFIPNDVIDSLTPKDREKLTAHTIKANGPPDDPIELVDSPRQKMTRSPEFKKWFGESKVVDEKNEPLVVYHGTADVIHEFDLDHPNRKDTGWLGTGVYLTTSTDIAGSYANLKAGSSGPQILPLFARVENPYHATLADKQRLQLISQRDGAEAGREAANKWTEELKSKGHDGVIIEFKASLVGKANASKEIVVFNPAGVKSATGNRGTFSRDDPNIQFDESEPLSTTNDLARIAADSARSRISKAATRIKALKKNALTPLPLLSGLIEQELRALQRGISADLSASMLGSQLIGQADVLTSIPDTFIPPPIAAEAPPEPPSEPPSIASLLGPDEPGPHVIFPAVEDALEVLNAAPVAARPDFRATAEAVRQGSFAITGDLTDAAVDDVRNLLAENIATGPDREAFIDAVVTRLGEGGPLSESRIENIFRTNTATALSDGQDRALKAPMVVDAFPYRAYYATTDRRVRANHIALERLGLNGTNIYHADDPTWGQFRPPWDFQCRCSWSPVTVEQAARRGVAEAREWLERANAMADQLGGRFEQYLNRTAPASPEYVTPPNFSPSPEFVRK